MAYDSTKPVTGGSLIAADMRENFRALKEDDIVEGVAALGIVEGMIAAGAVVEAKIGAAAVTQAKLKTSQGSVSGSSANGTLYLAGLPGGEYGFTPQVKSNTADWATFNGFCAPGAGTSLSPQVTTSYAAPGVAFTVDTGEGTNWVYAQQRYVTSSGEVFWIFILRDKITKEVKAMYQAPDHPCFGNGGKPLLVSHPFGSYDETKYEIIVINPLHEEVEAMKKMGERGENEPDKDLLEVIMEEYEIDEDSTPAWPTKAVTVGLPKDYETKNMGDKIATIKKVIPKMDFLHARSLKKKIKEVTP
jgi:hypothetical protein